MTRARWDFDNTKVPKATVDEGGADAEHALKQQTVRLP